MRHVKTAVFGVLGAAMVLVLGAQQSSQVLTVNAEVSSRFKIEINANNVTFTRTMDPRLGQSIPQNEAPLQIRVKGTRGFFQTVNLRIQAVGSLSDGMGHTIPIESVSWIAAGDGFTPNGQLSGAAQRLGRWTDSGSYEGTLAFSFQDNENFAPGIYTLVVTLSVSSI